MAYEVHYAVLHVGNGPSRFEAEIRNMPLDC